MDPAAILTFVLAAEGVPVVGALVAGFTQALKAIPGVKGFVEAQPVITTMILTALLILYAVFATAYVVDAVSGFGLALIWLAHNGFAKATYDTVSGKAPLG